MRPHESSTPRSPIHREHGTSLLEVTVALAIFATTLVSLAQLLALATRSNASSRVSTFTAILAEQKMEQLRSLQWAFDPLGLPLTDLRTNTAAFAATAGCDAATAGAAVGLTPSPDDALTTSVDGYVDYVDENGCGLGGGTTAPAGTAYVRRWSIALLPSAPDRSLVLQVRVTGAAQPDGGVGARRLPGEARLVALKTRKM